jgi:hypothetical protein
VGPNHRLALGKRDHSASMYVRVCVRWSPNWNPAGQFRCGACGEQRRGAGERSAWVALGSLSAGDQRQARREYASAWEQALWSVCGPRWRVPPPRRGWHEQKQGPGLAELYVSAYALRYRHADVCCDAEQVVEAHDTMHL